MDPLHSNLKNPRDLALSTCLQSTFACLNDAAGLEVPRCRFAELNGLIRMNAGHNLGGCSVLEPGGFVQEQHPFRGRGRGRGRAAAAPALAAPEFHAEYAIHDGIFGRQAQA